MYGVGAALAGPDVRCREARVRGRGSSTGPPVTRRPRRVINRSSRRIIIRFGSSGGICCYRHCGRLVRTLWSQTEGDDVRKERNSGDQLGKSWEASKCKLCMSRSPLVDIMATQSYDDELASQGAGSDALGRYDWVCQTSKRDAVVDRYGKVRWQA